MRRGRGSRRARRAIRAPHLRRGVGIASGIKNIGYSFGFPEQSTATVELVGDSRVEGRSCASAPPTSAKVRT